MYHYEPQIPKGWNKIKVMRNNLVHHRFSLLSAYLLTGSAAEELHLIIIYLRWVTVVYTAFVQYVKVFALKGMIHLELMNCLIDRMAWTTTQSYQDIMKFKSI